jgi:hypothetical protein
VDRRRVLVEIAEMVLAELPGRVTLILEEVRDGRRPVWDAVGGAGTADGEQPRPKRMLAEDERRATRSATLLPVGTGEQRASWAMRSMLGV